VTPAELITAIVTDRGVVRPVNATSIRSMVGQAGGWHAARPQLPAENRKPPAAR
jgi:hypothetical protein